MLNGKEIIILKNGQAIAATKSDEIQVGCETIPISSPTNGEWTSAIAGRKSWAFTVGFLIQNAGKMFDSAQMVGQSFTIRILQKYGLAYLEGTAICTAFKITASLGNLANGSFSFVGNGPLIFHDEDEFQPIH